MSEEPIAITNLNDFIFCPVSIYFHALDNDTEKLVYQDECQLNGSAVHEKTDSGEYSDKRSILQAISVYTERYGLYGKIDVFDTDAGRLTERKKKVNRIYDGYVFQLYAQCFALREMGYTVKELRIYSYDTNKNFDISLPEDDYDMLNKFETVISDIKGFSFDSFRQENAEKCKNCIYRPMCSFSPYEEE